MKVRFFPKPKALCKRLAIATGIVIFLPFIGFFHWTIDLASHFQVQATICQGAFSILSLFWKNWKSAAASGLLFLIGVFHLSPFLGWPQEKTFSDRTPLKITSLNVLSSNLEFDKVVSYLKKQESDVIFLSETTEIWERVILNELTTYPYVLKRPRSDNFGTHLLSRYPITEQNVIQAGQMGEPLLRAVIDFQGTPVTIIGLHPIPPIGKNFSRDNRQYLKAANFLIRSTITPLIVAGDFNATPWATNYKLLTQKGNLRSCAERENTLTTWNRFKKPWIPFTGLMLDHILYSHEFQKQAFEITPGLGSDHFGLTAEFTMPGAISLKTDPPD